MEWILLIVAVHINNPKDIPGKVTLEFATQQQCQMALDSLTYELKFKQFKVEGECRKK